MKSEYKEALNELYQHHPKVVSMDFVEWWLLKYSDLFNPLRRKLPPLLDWPDTNGEYAFRDAYRPLEKLSDYHRFTPQCKIAIAEFNELNSKIVAASDTELLNWVLKFEQLGGEDMGLFCIDYLDYEGEVYHLKIHGTDLFVEHKEFESIIEFCETFNPIYWSNFDLLAKNFPESLAARSV